MRHTEITGFDFHSGTSRDFEHLMARMGVSGRAEALTMALSYYGLFLNGVYNGGSRLVACTALTDEAFAIDDDIPQDYYIAGYAEVPADSRTLDFMTRHSRKRDASHMLSAAFTVMEKICNLRESGWRIGLHDRLTHQVTPLVMTPHASGTDAAAVEALQQAMRPAALKVH